MHVHTWKNMWKHVYFHKFCPFLLPFTHIHTYIYTLIHSLNNVDINFFFDSLKWLYFVYKSYKSLLLYSIWPVSHYYLRYYCTSGTASPVPCPSGTYYPYEAQGAATGCAPCTAGKACTKSGLTSPDSACSPGHYCPNGTVLPTDTPCPAGTFTNLNNLTDETQCQICPPTVACPAGTGGTQQPPQACAEVKNTICPPSGIFIK